MTRFSLNRARWHQTAFVFVALFLSIFLSSCRKTLQNETEIYSNDFESADATDSEGIVFSNFNGSGVAGNYHNEGLKLKLTGVQKHEYVKVSFDLNIHDYWDGNNAGNAEVTVGPDIWWMKVDGQNIIYTTFSNTVCNEVYCIVQSYPKNYPFNYNPREGVSVTDLPGFCAGGITSTYRIEKLIKHNGRTLELEFGDMLKNTNVPFPKCDESWSMDNLQVSILNIN